uniref:NADH dehydrogenase subunit 4L n=1 Tax=Trachypeplus jacobsoni TaxID=2172479 RepID=A0A343WNS1_9HEMI|nr:NADH dehydrogenase subunit 4L [Trachypeplus jacobsoni]AWD31647.1 NADH dehydrogenase subunit 4L [Trachypeplus jacobsoni]
MFFLGLTISYFCGFMVVFSMRAHLLLTLFGMEFLMVILYLIMYMNFIIYGLEFYFLMLFLVMLVSEGSLSLSILVAMIRSHGNDMIGSLYMMLW